MSKKADREFMAWWDERHPPKLTPEQVKAETEAANAQLKKLVKRDA